MSRFMDVQPRSDIDAGVRHATRSSPVLGSKQGKEYAGAHSTGRHRSWHIFDLPLRQRCRFSVPWDHHLSPNPSFIVHVKTFQYSLENMSPAFIDEDSER